MGAGASAGLAAASKAASPDEWKSFLSSMPAESKEKLKAALEHTNGTEGELVRLCGPQQYIKSIIYIEYKNTYIKKKKSNINYKFTIWFVSNVSFVFCVEIIEIVKVPKTCFLMFVVQIKGCYAVYRTEETKLVCAISMKCVFG